MLSKAQARDLFSKQFRRVADKPLAISIGCWDSTIKAIATFLKLFIWIYEKPIGGKNWQIKND